MQKPEKNIDLQQVQEYLSTLQKSGTFTITMQGTETVLGQIKKIKDEAISSLSLDQYQKDIQSLSFNLDTLRSAMATQFGTTKDDVGKIQQTIAISYKDVINLGKDINEIPKVQEAITKSLNTRLIATKDNVIDLIATSSVTNISPDKLIEGFREVGYSMSHIKEEMETVVGKSNQMGVNATEVSKRFMENIKQLNMFNFQNGVEGLAKMAAQSTQLGISMQTTFNLGEKLLDPQNAIDLSASLQRLGVTSSQLLDPLRAMNLAQNDPTELQNQLVELSKQFVKVKEDGSFEILPGAQRQMREIEIALGMNRGELFQMAKQSADVAKKMQEIRFPDGLNATEEQKNTLVNLAQFNKLTGKYEISLGLDESGKEIKKSIDDLPTGNEELQKILDKAQEGPPKMEDLAKGQLSELVKINSEGLKIRYGGKVETAMGGGDVIAKGAAKSVTTLTKSMNTEESIKRDLSMYQNMLEDSKGLRDKLDKGEDVSLKDVLNVLKGVGENYIKLQTNRVGGVLDQIGTETSNIPGLENMSTEIVELSKNLTTLSTEIDKFDFKKLEETITKHLPESIVNSIKEGWTMVTSKDALLDVSNNVVHKFDEGDITAFIQKDKVLGDKIGGEMTKNKTEEDKPIVINNTSNKDNQIVLDTTPLTKYVSDMTDNRNKINFQESESKNKFEPLNLGKFEIDKSDKFMDGLMNQNIKTTESLNTMFGKKSLFQTQNTNILTNQETEKINSSTINPPTEIKMPNQPNLMIDRKPQEITFSPIKFDLKISLDGNTGLELKKEHMDIIGEHITRQFETNTQLQQTISKITNDNISNASNNFGQTKKY